jgi:hypothetical protein
VLAGIQSQISVLLRMRLVFQLEHWVVTVLSAQPCD